MRPADTALRGPATARQPSGETILDTVQQAGTPVGEIRGGMAAYHGRTPTSSRGSIRSEVAGRCVNVGLGSVMQDDHHYCATEDLAAVFFGLGSSSSVCVCLCVCVWCVCMWCVCACVWCVVCVCVCVWSVCVYLWCVCACVCECVICVCTCVCVVCVCGVCVCVCVCVCVVCVT